MRRAAALALALLASRAATAAELLPDLSVHLEATRYEPTETDFHWSGWIGGGAGLVRAGGATAYFTADTETLLGEERRPFEANQVNYHLELGVRRPLGRVELAGFLHHVSRHAVDRAKPEAVDWNIVGLRAALRFPERSRLPGRAWLSAGRATLASRVGYRWELAAALEAEFLAGPRGRVYLRGGLRALGVDATSELARDGFVDASIEGGLRFPKAAGVVDAYVAYERRNDVFLLVAGRRSRALFGIRFALGDQPAFR